MIGVAYRGAAAVHPDASDEDNAVHSDAGLTEAVAGICDRSGKHSVGCATGLAAAPEGDVNGNTPVAIALAVAVAGRLAPNALTGAAESPTINRGDGVDALTVDARPITIDRGDGTDTGAGSRIGA